MSIQPISTIAPPPSRRRKVEPHSFDSLPLEMFMVIFSQGEWSLKDLGRICRSSRRFNQIVGLNSAINPSRLSSSCGDFFKNLWKKAVYKELSFNDTHWRDLTIPAVVEDEIPEKDFKTLPLEEVVHDLREIKDLYPGRKATESLMLVRIPKVFNNSMAFTLSHYVVSSELHKGLWDQYRNVLSENFKEIVMLMEEEPYKRSKEDEFLGILELASRWVLITTNPLKPPLNRVVKDQQTNFLAHYKLATLVDVSACSLALVAKAPATTEIFHRINRDYKSFIFDNNIKQNMERVFVRNFIDPEKKV